MRNGKTRKVPFSCSPPFSNPSWNTGSCLQTLVNMGPDIETGVVVLPVGQLYTDTCIVTLHSTIQNLSDSS